MKVKAVREEEGSEDLMWVLEEVGWSLQMMKSFLFPQQNCVLLDNILPKQAFF